MKIAAAIAGLMLLAGPAALSQPTGDPATPDPASYGPITPTPAAMDHARHLLVVMHLDSMLDQMTTQIMGSMMGPMLKSLPADKQAAGEAMKASIIQDTKAMGPRYAEAMVQIYSRNLTEQELSEMDTFYSGPTGQAVLTKIPALTGKLMPLAMAQLPVMMRHAFDQYCSKTPCTPADRAAMERQVRAMTQRLPTAS